MNGFKFLIKEIQRSKAAQRQFLSEESKKSDITESESGLEFEKEQKQKYYAFQSDHPLYQTHQVSIDKSVEVIPNFAGGTLSRCDHGDREYYCATMLTLFKPWRSGKI